MQKNIKPFCFFVIYNHAVKYIITLCIPKLLQKKFYFFSLQYIRMSGKNINFDHKNSKKVNFTETKK